MPMLRCLPFACQPPNCHVEPLTFDTFPMQTIVWLCYRFCSAPLIALLVAGEVEDCSMVDRILLGYHNISYLINASIYLVKGGRLGLMPGVLFHSCRPSFRHTSVMFPNFVFLTRLGDLWDPLDSSLWIKLFQQGPTLVLPFASPPPIPFPWVGQPEGHLYFGPPEPMLV